MRVADQKVLWIAVLVLTACLSRSEAGQSDWTGSEQIPVLLKQGNFVILHYPAKLSAGKTTPKALILFGSGCGGWSYWEENVCHQLQDDGYEVLGIDFARYAQTDYDLATLEADYGTLVQYALAPYGQHAPPVILGGWSTGAEQAVAVAGGPNPPLGLVGLLLVSPGSEGGYGPKAISYLDLSAPASKLFKLSDFAPKLIGLRIVQWHAEFDPLDSSTWLQTLKAPHRKYVFPGALHDYHGACAEFLSKLIGSVSWILGPDSVIQPHSVLASRRD